MMHNYCLAISNITIKIEIKYQDLFDDILFLDATFNESINVL